MAKKIVIVKKRVLVADGDEGARMLIQKVLKHGGYDVMAVSDGKLAIEALAERKYDLMILDLELLHIKWVELVRRALALRKKISVIILTNIGSLDSAIQAIRFHVSDYMVKPVVPRELLDSVRNALKDQESIEIPHISPRSGARIKKLATLIKVEIEPGLWFDRERRWVYNSNGSVSLTNTENKIFACLVDLPERVVAPTEIIDIALGYTVKKEDAAKMLRPVMCRLKKKLVQLGLPKNKIQNVRGNGYVLERKLQQL